MVAATPLLVDAANESTHTRISLVNAVSSDADEKPPYTEIYAVGELAFDSGSPGQDNAWLVETTQACCGDFQTAIHITGEIDFASFGKDRVAVFGSLKQIPTLEAPTLEVAAITISEYIFEVTNIVPAEQLIERPNTLELLKADQLSYFLQAIIDSGLYHEISHQEKLTIFAPIDQAFLAMGEEQLQNLFSEDRRQELREMVLRHIAPDSIACKQLFRETSIAMLSDEVIQVAAENGKLRIGDSRVLWKNMRSDRGFVHIVADFLPASGTMELPH
jgi:uncharacterized surface protein with fasciclin (FAS1) repeats